MSRFSQVGFVNFFILLFSLAAQSAYASPFLQPNLYELSGDDIKDDIKIVYSTSSLKGTPHLRVRSAHGNHSFQGDQIRVTRSEMGKLVSVTLGQIPDLKSVILTLVIPNININANEGMERIKTFVVHTVNRTSFGGPELLEGQTQFHSTTQVHGKASHVNFIEYNVSGEVILSPTCPGPQSIDQNCESPFVGALVQILDQFNNTVARAKTNEKGFFQVNVQPPGKYTVRTTLRNIIPIPRPEPTPTPLPGDSISPIDLNKTMDVQQSTDSDLIAIPLYPMCQDTPVKVPEVGSVFVRIQCDTGIR